MCEAITPMTWYQTREFPVLRIPKQRTKVRFSNLV